MAMLQGEYVPCLALLLTETDAGITSGQRPRVCERAKAVSLRNSLLGVPLAYSTRSPYVCLSNAPPQPPERGLDWVVLLDRCMKGAQSLISASVPNQTWSSRAAERSGWRKTFGS